MFKPLKKRNDNFAKRDFFAVKKTKQKCYAIVGGKIEGLSCFMAEWLRQTIVRASFLSLTST